MLHDQIDHVARPNRPITVISDMFIKNCNTVFSFRSKSLTSTCSSLQSPSFTWSISQRRIISRKRINGKCTLCGTCLVWYLLAVVPVSCGTCLLWHRFATVRSCCGTCLLWYLVAVVPVSYGTWLLWYRFAAVYRRRSESFSCLLPITWPQSCLVLFGDCSGRANIARLILPNDESRGLGRLLHTIRRNTLDRHRPRFELH